MSRLHDLTDWLEESKGDFLPPVCAKNLHNEQNMILFVGGPNQRKDYHIDCGEELFYQLKGDMLLKVAERGRHKDVHIKEGQIFLLPARVPHSPQRFKDTLGLISERVRDPTEPDGIRYYVEDNGKTTTTELWEAWFHCEDIPKQLPGVLKQFTDSEQAKTGRPIPGTILDQKPVVVDTVTKLMEPVNLKEWITNNRAEIDQKGHKYLFDSNHQMEVYVCGAGENADYNKYADMFLWQQEGASIVSQDGHPEVLLKQNHSLLVPHGTNYNVKQEQGSLLLAFGHDPTKAITWPRE